MTETHIKAFKIVTKTSESKTAKTSQSEPTYSLSYRHIIDQIKNVLLSLNLTEGNTESSNAYNAAESFDDCTMANVMFDGYSIDSRCEGGKLTVLLRYSSSGKLIIEVNHLNPKNRSGVYHSLVSIKYAINEDDVWRISQTLTTAIYKGSI
jgi:uncharacterized secreted protein with C-terminal beta-propeller domain